MAFNKWNTSGNTTWADGQAVTASDINNTVDEVYFPIGTIIGWAKTITGTPALPSYWVECNGQTLADAESPFNNQAIPNLNSTGRLLRGSATSGTTGGAETHTHTMTGDTQDTNAGSGAGGEGYPYSLTHGAHHHSYTQAYGAQGNYPLNMAIVWIMRVK